MSDASATAFDLKSVPLKCPGCENDDKSLMAVCGRIWLRASDLAPLTAVPRKGGGPQAVDPAVPVLGDDTIECQAEVEDEFSPICRHRGSVDDFALFASGVDVQPLAEPAVHGEPTPQPAAATPGPQES